MTQEQLETLRDWIHALIDERLSTDLHEALYRARVEEDMLRVFHVGDQPDA